MNNILKTLVSISLLVFIFACDGYRSIRADINLRNQNNDNSNQANELIDNIAITYKLSCSYKYDDYFRACSLYSARLASRVNPSTGVLSIDLSEFGPIYPTKYYKLLSNEITELVNNNFIKGSVIWNPERCSDYYKKDFYVKLPSDRPKVLYFIPWSVEQGFNKTYDKISFLARSSGMRESGCYAMNNKDICVSYEGGEYIGVWESVRLDVLWNASSQEIHIGVSDRSCKESKLTKYIYDELLTMMKNIYGESSIYMK